MFTLSDSPALHLFILAAAILGLHMLLLALWTGTVRALRKEWINVEDARLNKGKQVEVDHVDVARVKRAHQNAMENALPFFVIGFFYALTGPSRTAALIYFGVFVAVRLLHTFFYLAGVQPFRTLSFGVGVLATFGMGVQIIRAAIA